jgi:nucleoside phosphorylase
MPGLHDGLLAAVTGIGKTSTQTILPPLFARYHPLALISLGFAAGLSPNEQPGDVILSSEVLTEEVLMEKTASLFASAGFVDKSYNIAKQTLLRCHPGSIVAVSRLLMTPTTKANVWQKTNAVAADMEGYWIAWEAEKASVPWLVIRSILDPFNMKLPSLAQRILADPDHKEIHQTTHYILGGVWRVPELIRLALRARTATQSLKEVVRQIVMPLSQISHSLKGH